MAKIDEKTGFFKTTSPAGRASKADQITETVRGIIADENKTRSAKTERLKALRLEKEAAEAAAKEAAPEKPKRKSAKAKAEPEAEVEAEDTGA